MIIGLLGPRSNHPCRRSSAFVVAVTAVLPFQSQYCNLRITTVSPPFFLSSFPLPSSVAGRFAAEEGTKECSLCSPGTYQNAPQQKACELCPPGATSLVGDKECTACDGSSVARFAGSPRCENCPLGTFSSSGIACSCEPGKYSLTTLGQVEPRATLPIATPQPPTRPSHSLT